jgi:branched-chain amino acid transport system substrate-binding protein
MLGIGLTAVKGDSKNTAGFAAALTKATIDSPRGKFTISKAHNPIQDMYLRQVSGKENKVIGFASKALEDPATGCRM